MVARSEQVIAELAAPLKALVDQQEALQAAVTEDEPINADEMNRLFNEAKPLQQDIELLDVWGSIREQYDTDPQATGVGLRAGWQVVDMYGTSSDGGIGALLHGIAQLFRGN